MSPEVIKKKLVAIAAYLDDLRPYEKISFDGFMQRHYEIERILELLIVTASDVVLHALTARGEVAPSSYRAVFQRAGEMGLLSPTLSKSLALSPRDSETSLLMNTKKSIMQFSIKAFPPLCGTFQR